MKKNVFLAVLLCLFHLTICSQNVGRDPQGISNSSNGRNYQLDFDLTLQKMMLDHNSNRNRNFDLNTEPFLFKNWDNSLIIYTKQGKRFKVKESNYHVKNDYFVTKISKDSVYIWDDSNVEYFIIGQKKFKNINNSFYNVLSSSGSAELILLKKFLSFKINSSKDNPLAIPTKTDKIKLKKNYFFFKNDRVHKVKLNKKNFIKFIGNQNNEEILNYVKSNKLSFKKEKDVIKIIDYYNSL